MSDDIADDTVSGNEADRHRKLESWREDLERCFSDDAKAPVFVALRDAISRFNLPKTPFYDLLDGVQMDLSLRRYRTFDELELYCRRVASSVGRISVRLFGCSSSGADLYADKLGIAFQLTNIMRDVDEDLVRDRIYLPLDDLDRFGYGEADLKRRVFDHRFQAVMEYQCDRALSYFKGADPNLAGNQSQYLFAAEIMKRIYRGTLLEIKRHKFYVFENRVVLPKWRLTMEIVNGFWSLLTDKLYSHLKIK